MAAVNTALTLYDIEEHLVALTDSLETVTPDQEQEFLEDFKAALTSAAESGIESRIIWHTSNINRSSRQRRYRGFRNSRRSVRRHRCDWKAMLRTVFSRWEGIRRESTRSSKVTLRSCFFGSVRLQSR